jgi:hypothetical protein
VTDVGEPSAGVDEASDPRPALPVLDDTARSTDPSVCPFLRRDVDGGLTAPHGEPSPDHSCIAIGAPRPQSLRQQELVCLRAAHADCPRYLRGAMVAAPVVTKRASPTVPRATLAALLILVLSAGISFGFVVQRGGIAMPVVEAQSTDGIAAGPTATTAPTDTATAEPAPTDEATPDPPPSSEPSTDPSATAEPTAPPSPTSSPSPAATPAPTPTTVVTPRPERTPRPTPKPTRKPASDRYRLLVECPDRNRCWIYTVRSGDNLYSIANYFGHSLAVIYDWNPRYPDQRLRVGDPIRMPAPTR